MKSVKKDKLTITSGVHNWEVIQQSNGKADIYLEGTFIEDFNDDTEQDLPFSQSNIYARIVKEDDGSAITPLLQINSFNDTWNITIKDIPCGGPYMTDFVILDIENHVEYPVRGERRRHFCVGDNYLVAGQSNAAGMGKGVMSEPPETGIHILRNLESWDIATQPFNDYDYSKYSMFMTFAKKVKKECGYPIGLIPAAMGGAGISRFIPDECGDLYEKMADATFRKGIGIRAVLWYQGCSDAGLGETEEGYICRFEKFVNSVRKDFEKSNLPIFTFQLNRQIIKATNENLDNGYDAIREAQRIAAKKIPNVYVLPAIDATIMSDFIHSSKASNMMLGERLASSVLYNIYGIGMNISAPDIFGAKLNDEKTVVLEFANVVGFLDTFNVGYDKLPFTVEDDKGRNEITDYRLKQNIIELILKRPCVGNVFVSGQSGTDPKNIIIDFYTQLPMLCFKKFTVL